MRRRLRYEGPITLVGAVIVGVVAGVVLNAALAVIFGE